MAIKRVYDSGHSLVDPGVLNLHDHAVYSQVDLAGESGDYAGARQRVDYSVGSYEDVVEIQLALLDAVEYKPSVQPSIEGDVQRVLHSINLNLARLYVPNEPCVTNRHVV